MKKSSLNIAGHCSGTQDVRHSQCGGELAITGTGTLRLPVGLGFALRGSKFGFGIDTLTYKVYSGFCLKCNKSGAFIRDDAKPRSSVKHVPRIDRAVNIASHEQQS